MNVYSAVFAVPLLCAALVGCTGAARPTPEATAKTLGEPSGLSIAVFYDALSSGAKPNALRDEGEPLIGKLLVEVSPLDSKTFQPSGESKFFTTSDKEALFVPLPAGLYRVRAASVQPFDAKYQWLETGPRSWFVRLDGRFTQTAFFPRVCRGAVITGPDELYRCDGKAFFAKPELPAFTLSNPAVAPVYECSHDSNATSLGVTVKPAFASSGGLVSVSLTSPGAGISVSGQQQIKIGDTGSFRLETRRTPPGNYRLTVTGTLGASGYTGSIGVTVITDTEGAAGDCYSQLEGNTRGFGPVHALADGTIFAGDYDGGSKRGTIRRFAPGATVSTLSYTTPAVTGGASGIVQIGSSVSGEVYASTFSIANTSTTPTVSGQLLRLSASGWLTVPLPLQSGELPMLLATWNNSVYVSTVPANSSSASSRLIEVSSGLTLLSAPSGEVIRQLFKASSRLFLAVQTSASDRVYEWQNGALILRCTAGGAVVSLSANAQGELLIGARNAVYQLATGGDGCMADARAWAADSLLIPRAVDGVLIAANASQNGGNLLIEQGGSSAPLYPNQALPTAYQMIANDGRLWIATRSGLYRITP